MVAYQLERLGLRGQSGPFDWIVVHTAGLIALLENHLTGFMDRENLAVHEGRVPGYWLVEDTRYDTWCFHEFKNTPCKCALYDYQEELRVVRRRTERFKRLMQSDMAILFVRRIATRNEAMRIYTAIQSWRGKKVSELLCINPDGGTRIGSGNAHPHIRFQENSEMDDLEKNPDAWKGIDSEWNSMLGGIELTQLSVPVSGGRICSSAKT